MPPSSFVSVAAKQANWAKMSKEGMEMMRKRVGYQKQYKGKKVEISKITKEWGTPLLYLAEYENNEKFKQNIYLFI